MRVIAGEFRSRRLKSIPGLATRPTPDRLRETLFNILAPRIDGAVFLDAYAGTGAVGIEALSRGARHVYFLERSRPAIEVIRVNLSSLGLQSRATVASGPVLLTLERFTADIVFLDPPYELVREYRATMDWMGEHAPPLAIVQHSVRFALADEYGALRRTRLLKQGDNALSFYMPSVAEEDVPDVEVPESLDIVPDGPDNGGVADDGGHLP
jgi:16S rRNA (guanine966-N2)-methyltransferase